MNRLHPSARCPRCNWPIVLARLVDPEAAPEHLSAVCPHCELPIELEPIVPKPAEVPSGFRSILG